MSWDVVIMKTPGDGEGTPQPTLGDAGPVREAISRCLPNVDWSDPAWGVLEGAGWSIEFNFAAAGPVDSFMLHVRGGGDPLGAITKLCRENDWVALDMSTGDYLDLRSPSDAGWKSFQGFRDSVLSHVEAHSRLRRALLYLLPALVVVLIVLFLRSR